jgi:DNA polymerase III epsilon subunit-like protein
MTETSLVFIDTETTGLDPNAHEIWEVGLFVRRPTSDPSGLPQGVVPRDETSRHHWFVKVDLKEADPKALDIGRFYERYQPRVAVHPRELVDALWRIIPHRAHLVGAVVSFDEERLRKLFRYYTPDAVLPVPWHYHLVDVEALAAGMLSQEPPWASESLAERLGVPIDPDRRHSALGDAEWAMRVYDRVMAGPAAYEAVTPTGEVAHRFDDEGKRIP